MRDYGVEYDPGRLQELEEAVEDLQQFAEEVRQELEARPTTKRRRSRESWNADFPEQKFKDTYSFSRNFKRGLQAVKERYYL